MSTLVQSSGNEASGSETEGLPFSKVFLGIHGRVKVEYGVTHTLSLATDQAFLPYFNVSVVDGLLIIEQKPGVILIQGANGVDTKIVIQAPEIQEIHYNGSGTLRIKDGFPSQKALTIRTSGSGSITAYVNASDSVTVDVSGTGDVTLLRSERNGPKPGVPFPFPSLIPPKDIAGAVTEARYRTTGVGSVRAGKVEVKRAKAMVSGAGSISTWATEELEAMLEGTGDVCYKGNPTTKGTSNGSGRLNRIRGCDNNLF